MITTFKIYAILFEIFEVEIIILENKHRFLEVINNILHGTKYIIVVLVFRLYDVNP